MTRHSSKVVIFDGVCNVCNGAVNFIIKHDDRGQFLFAPNQSEAARVLLQQHGLERLADDTFVLVEGNDYLLRTDAALAIAAELTTPWRWFRILRVLPRGFRDFFYDLLGRYRYRLFGKRDVCMVPDVTVKHRFLESSQGAIR